MRTRALFDPRIAKRLKRILTADSVQISRAVTNAGITSWSQVYDGFGTHQGPNWSDMRPAGLADDVYIDETFSFPSGVDVRETDRMTTPRGNFSVLAVATHRFRTRVFLRKLG